LENKNKELLEQETIVGTKASEIIKETNQKLSEETGLGDTQVINTAQIKEQLTNDNSDITFYEKLDEEDDFSSPTKKDKSQEELPTQEQIPTSKELENVEAMAKRKKKIKISAKHKKYLLTTAIILLLLFVAAYIAGILTLQANRIHKNVYIEHLNVGGMTYDEALKAVHAAEDKLFTKQNITLLHNGQRYTIDGSVIGLVASAEETAKKAYNYGKTGNKAFDGFFNMLLMFRKHTVVPVANLDTEKLNEQISNFGTQCYGELKQHNVVVQADGLVYIGPGKTGFDSEIKAARDTILNSLDKDRYSNIKVPLSSKAPDKLTLEQFDAAVYCDPTDAYYKYENDTVTVVAESIGRYINKEEAKPLLENVTEGGEPVYIPWYKVEPSVTAQMMADKLFTSKLGSYSTYYGGTYNRNSNVERAAELMNGAVLAPGDVLSFNDRVGPRTVANGFYTAPEYLNGKTVEGIGGGTCQVSTTLYGAVLYAGLDIVSRTNHMFAVSYAPLGQDATVAYGSVDFKFKNNSDYPIKITVATKGGTITVDVLGAAWEPEQTVKLEHSVKRGTNTNVTSKRIFYSNGEVIKTENLPSSHYKPHVEETSQPTEAPEETSTPTPEPPAESQEPSPSEEVPEASITE